MRNWTKLFCVMMLLVTVFGSVGFAVNRVNITIDGVAVKFNDDLGYPFVDSANRTQVPFKAAMEAFGSVVEWDQMNRHAIAEYRGVVVKVPIGMDYIIKNNERISIDTKAIIINGRTYLPIAAVLRAFGAEVNWNGTTSTVEVYRPMSQQSKVSNLDLSELMKRVNSERKQSIYSKSLPKTSQYREDFSSTLNYFSDDEILTLLSPKSKVNALSKEEALADVETLFKYLKSSYGAYTYFGGDEKFGLAKKQIESSILTKSTLNYEMFTEIIQSALKFVRDEHFVVDGKRPGVTASVNYKYFSASSHHFDKDEIGYYKNYDGEKWYFTSTENPFISIKPTLLLSGEIVYSPVFFGPITEPGKLKTFELKNGEKTITENFNWYSTKHMITDPITVKSDKVERMEGIAYIPFRTPHFSMSTIEDYKSAGLRMKNEDTIILDARGNGGSGDPNQYGWFSTFAGGSTKGYEYRSIRSLKTSKLSLKAFESMSNRMVNDKSYLGDWRVVESLGRWIENDTRVIVLLDDKIGSSGEGLIYMLREMDNVIFVGSNTSGCTICGMVYNVYLPNSGMSISSGTMLLFHENDTNTDGIGFEPDLWCEPNTSIEAVLKMIKLYDQ